MVSNAELKKNAREQLGGSAHRTPVRELVHLARGHAAAAEPPHVTLGGGKRARERLHTHPATVRVAIEAKVNRRRARAVHNEPLLQRSQRRAHAVELVVEQLHDAVLAVLHHVGVKALQLVGAEHAARHVLVELDHGAFLHHEEVDWSARAHELVVRGKTALLRTRDLGVGARALGVVGLTAHDLGVGGELVGALGRRIAKLVLVTEEQVDVRVEAHLRYLNDAGESLEHTVRARRVRKAEIIQHTLERRRDEEVARARDHLSLVHDVRHGAQAASTSSAAASE